MKVKKAIIPAAGLGTRCLPATKVLSKEMLPIVDKPTIQYIVEEAVASGITDIMIIISKGKGIIADHFDNSDELERKLEGKNYLDEVKAISRLANICYVRQQNQGGLGAAVLLAEAFIGNDPFAVLYGDDVIIGETPCIKQLCDAYEEFGGGGAVSMMAVPKEDISKYGSLKVENRRDNLYKVTDMIEKPAPGKEFSFYSIAGRCVLPGKIFEILKNTPKGYGGELQLTDAMKQLAISESMTGVDFIGKRYDMGNKLGILKANVEVGLSHPEIGDNFKNYLLNLVKEMN